MVSVLAEDSAAVVNQSRATEGTREILDKSSSCMREPPQLSSTEKEDRSNAVGTDDEGKSKDIENREAIINHGEDCNFTASEMPENVQGAAASEEVLDAFIINSESQGNFQTINNADEKNDTLLLHEDIDIRSAASSFILHDVEIAVNSADEIDVSLTSKAPHIDDKWKRPNDADKEAKHNHGDNVLQTIQVKLNSEDYVVYITSGQGVNDDKLEILTKGQKTLFDNTETCVVPGHRADDIKQNEFPGPHSKAALVSQHCATEATTEIVEMRSSCKKELNPISSDRSAAERVDDGGENRDNAVSYESYGDIKLNENREIMLYSHDDGVECMVSEMLDNIQVELTSEEVVDAFIVSKETIDNIKEMVASDEEKETITMHEDVCSVTSSWTLHNVQIDLTSVEGIDVCLTSISTHCDDKWKEEENSHGNQNVRMASVEIISDAQLRSPKRVPKIFTGIKQNCGIPCETHAGVYRFEIKVHIKEEGKERFVPHSRPSPLPRRTTRRALALIEDTLPLSNPLSTAAEADPVKHLNSDNNQFNETGDDVDNSKNVADNISGSKTGHTENFTTVAKDIKESKIGHVENSANVREDIKESKIGRVPSSILRKSTLKKRKERQDHLYDEKSVYSTFSTDTYDSFQSLVREVEKEALLCFVKVGRYLGL